MRKLFPFLLFLATAAAFAQNPPYAPDRRPGEGEGPFQRLIIRGATVIDGTGAPPIGRAQPGGDFRHDLHRRRIDEGERGVGFVENDQCGK